VLVFISGLFINFFFNLWKKKEQILKNGRSLDMFLPPFWGIASETSDSAHVKSRIFDGGVADTHRSDQSLLQLRVRGSFRGSGCSFPNSALLWASESPFPLFPFVSENAFQNLCVAGDLGELYYCWASMPTAGEKLDCLNTVIVIYWYWEVRKMSSAHAQKHRMGG